MSPVALQRLRHPSENLHALSIVSADLHAPAEGKVNRCLKRDIIQADGDGQSPLAQLEHAVRVTPLSSAACEERESPPQQALVAQRLGEGLGLTGVINALRPLAQRQQGAAGVEVDIDRSRLPLRLLREMPERVERLLEIGRRLPIGRALRGLCSGMSVPTTDAIWSIALSPGGNRSMRAASTACTVAGTWMAGRGRASR